MKKFFSIIIILLMLVGCSTYPVDRYTVSVSNMVTLKKLPIETLSVGNFSGSVSKIRSEVLCNITPPDGLTLAEFIRMAVIDELRMADKYDENAPVALNGQLKDAQFKVLGHHFTGNKRGEWNLELELVSSNGEWLKVSENYKYVLPTLYEEACMQIARSLVPAVQDLIHKAVSDPQFVKLASKN